jgi:hypothetical protein
MSEPKRDSYGNFTDGYGTVFQTPDGKAPSAWTPIQVVNSDGTKTAGTWTGSAEKSKS